MREAWFFSVLSLGLLFAAPEVDAAAQFLGPLIAQMFQGAANQQILPFYQTPVEQPPAQTQNSEDEDPMSKDLMFLDRIMDGRLHFRPPAPRQQMMNSLGQIGAMANLVSRESQVVMKPVARSDFAMVNRGTDGLYIFGGLDPQNDFLNDFWRFDLEASTWSPLPSDQAPMPRCWHAMGINPELSKLYVFGGYNQTHDLNDLWRFEFATAQWREIATVTTAPPARDRHSVVSTDKGLIVFGGYNGKYLNDVWIYAFNDNSWSLMETSAPSSSGPMPRRAHGAAMFSTKMYVYGGNNGLRTFGDMWILNIETAEWSEFSRSTRPSPRTRGALVGDGRGSMFLFGGFDGANFRYDIWKMDKDSESWLYVDPNDDRPIERADFAMVGLRASNSVDKGRLFICGGFDGHTKFSDVYQFEISMNQWIKLA